MTKDRNRKLRTRSRMEKTGERYAAARRHIHEDVMVQVASTPAPIDAITEASAAHLGGMFDTPVAEKPANDGLPTCPTCRALIGTEDVLARELPKVFTTAGQVWATTGGIRAETHTHAARKSGLIARYRLAARIPCSFPDRTPHLYGYVVRTLCGAVINIGHVCGAHWIVGLEDVIKYASDLEAIEQARQQLLSEPDVLRDDWQRLASRLTALANFKSRVESMLPTIAAFLRDRHSRKGASRTEVTVEVVTSRDGETVTKEEIRSLVGLELWDAGHSASHLEREVARVSDALESSRREDPDLQSSARALARQLDKVRSKLKHEQHWADICDSFFSDRNLEAVVTGARELARDSWLRTPAITARAGGFVFQTHREWRWLSLEGLFQTNPPVEA